ncbi:acyl carrier protein [Clostridium fallax]|uniref:Acyl carrier protein n=1 Tax=Clostridium fallax TaxID=1533 RepID=A0A1M4VT80_9CLOT|nr:acyl carrier protein [Clostridium fallax]SHE72244.1 acyl carrier protein [Clostridium fallax]SQB07683.1 phosphopantetheine-binding protein [Clostridium fallax]
MIFEQIREVVVDQLGVKEEEVTLKTNFIEDLGADSLDLFQIIMDLEDKFDIKIEDVEEIKTVEDAVNFVKERVDNEE